MARYYRASRSAHRAWCRSQPQYVIPGVLEEVDATRADTSSWSAAASISSSAPVPLSFPAGALDSHTTGPGRTPSQGTRGRGQEV